MNYLVDLKKSLFPCSLVSLKTKPNKTPFPMIIFFLWNTFLSILNPLIYSTRSKSPSYILVTHPVRGAESCVMSHSSGRNRHKHKWLFIRRKNKLFIISQTLDFIYVIYKYMLHSYIYETYINICYKFML